MNQIDPATSAPHMYARVPGDADRVYRALCSALVEREVDWEAFSEADWRLLVYMADPKREGVGPALYWRFRQRAWPGEMPGAVRAHLERMYYNTLAQNTILLGERDRVLGRFESHGIEAIVLKGTALVETVYEDIGMRPMGDIDLLLQEGDLSEARALLAADGYRTEKPDLRPGVNEEIGFETTLVNAARFGFPVLIELHWKLLDGVGAFQDVHSTTHSGRVPLHGLADDDCLLYACAHLAYKHLGRRERLIWYYDFYLLQNGGNPGLDWDALLARALALGWVEGTVHALEGAARRFPDLVTMPNRGAWLANADMTAFAEAIGRSQTDFGTVRNRLDQLSLKGRLLRVLSNIFPTFEYMHWRYRPEPAWLMPLYYPVRWLRFLLRVGKRA